MSDVKYDVIDERHYKLNNVRTTITNKAKPIIVEIDDNQCWIPTTIKSKNKGYVYVYDYNAHTKIKLHKKVLEIKLDRKLKPNEMTRHICNNPSCCNPNHLMVGVAQDNVDDMVNSNRAVWQKEDWYDTLKTYNRDKWVSDDIVLQISNDFINGEHNYRTLDNKYGVCRGTTTNIVHRKTHTDITSQFDFESIINNISSEAKDLFVNVKNLHMMGYKNNEIAEFLNSNRETVRHIVNDDYYISYDDIDKSMLLTEPFVYISGIIPCSVVDGEGLRTTVFFSFCNLHCKGCHNKNTTWALTAGNKMLVKDLINTLINQPYDITLSGGECLCQYKAVELIVKAIKTQTNKNIWLYSGHTWEELINTKDRNKFKYEDIFPYIDILVDGRFISSLASPTLRFRGSSNQRIIDVKKSKRKPHIISSFL